MKNTTKAEENAKLLQCEIADALCKEAGFFPGDSVSIAAKVVEYLRKRIGGQEIYIPAESKNGRNASIYEMYNGRNSQEVMKKFGLKSRASLHYIVKNYRERQRRAVF